MPSEAKTAVEAIDKVTTEITKAQGQVDRAIAAAAQVENAMEGYDGLPTAAQFRQVDWAWEDGTASATAVNKADHRRSSGGLFFDGRSGEAAETRSGEDSGALTACAIVIASSETY